MRRFISFCVSFGFDGSQLLEGEESDGFIQVSAWLAQLVKASAW